ncbi:hypothetical protein [Streptomyces sp. SID3343]|uniref:hypothetical protein n=1 Tax=Streptomyces sp. SID3343 TaxID=2690260 RepID=UPI001368978C|nr:hypothetical protein [Streptomyces sp. SID3343]MYV97141.1 hypothetical protein [Streptomyces sp. SID3343]
MTAKSGMTLAVYRVDRDGARVVRQRELFTGSDSAAWPWDDGWPKTEPPCACSPNCRYLHRD